MSRHNIPKVYIVVLNWNGWEDTVACLQSLGKLSYSDYEILVVDNGSTNNSVKHIRRAFPAVDILQLHQNLGYAGGNNAGIERSLDEGADYIWILNNDTIVDKKALQVLVDKMEAHPTMGVCGSKLIYYHKQDEIQMLAGGKFYRWIGHTINFGQHQPVEASFDVEEIESELDFIIGASMFVSRNCIEETGMFEEDYFLYFEEVDWGIRAKKKFTLGFCTDSIVYHKEGASIGANSLRNNDKSRLSDYYFIKNRFKIVWKFYPWFLPLVYITSFYSIFNRMRRGQWDRIPMILKLFFTFNSGDRYEDSQS